MFTKSLVVAAIAGLASSAPLAPRDSAGAFGLIAIRSGSVVQNSDITASDYGFWINKPTASDCPTNLGSACPAGNETALTFSNSTSSLAMDVVVPGGQQVYVTPSGEFGYTIPHSAALPAGAVTTGFKYTPPAASNSVGTLTFGNGTQGFLACPTGDGDVYQVVASNGTNSDSCLGIDLATVAYGSGYAAWEYA